jgi:hypothetical protein
MLDKHGCSFQGIAGSDYQSVRCNHFRCGANSKSILDVSCGPTRTAIQGGASGIFLLNSTASATPVASFPFLTILTGFHLAVLPMAGQFRSKFQHVI